MTKEQAEQWKAEIANSPLRWELDSIHSEPSDLLFYQGKESGCFAHFCKKNDAGFLNIGTFDGAFSSIGDAIFCPLGKKPFADAVEAIVFLVSKAKVKLSPAAIRLLMKKGLL
jgi:hypothetical protein